MVAIKVSVIGNSFDIAPLDLLWLVFSKVIYLIYELAWNRNRKIVW